MKFSRFTYLLLILFFAQGAFAQLAEIGDYVWEDLDADGMQDVGEPGMAGVTVLLNGTDINGMPVAASTQTDALGHYRFSNLVAGNYQLTFNFPSGGGFQLTPANQADPGCNSDPLPPNNQTSPLFLVPGESNLTIDAGFYRFAQLGNLVWNDLNGNGLQELTEPGLPGVTVTLSGTTTLGTSVLLTKTSDALGAFLFNNLVPGTYALSFTSPAPGWAATPQDQGSDDQTDSDIDPATLSTPGTVLISAEADLSLDAGFYQFAQARNFVWNDLNADGIQDAGELGIQGIQVDLLGTTGTGAPVARTLTSDANGLCLFDNLAPGAYRFSFAYPPGCQTAAPKDQGADNTVDSDIDVLTRITATELLTSGEINDSYDAGFFTGTVLGLVGTQCGPGEITCTIQSSAIQPVSYAWTSVGGSSGNGSTSSNPFVISSLPSGAYTVTIVDGTGCFANASTSVTATPVIDLVLTPTPVSCFNGNNGSISGVVTGGTPPYSFLWSNGFTVLDLPDLPAGNYVLTVTDANGCSKTGSATVTQPTALTLSTINSQVLCNGGSDGDIDLTVTGGVPFYTYIWSNSATTQDLINVVAGTYTVTVTDFNGCSKTTSAPLSQPTLLATSTIVTNVSCNGGANGSIDLTVTGGTPAYTYNWSNGANTQDLVNVVAGTYTVTVSDLHNCTKTTSVTVGQPTQIVLTTVPMGVSCNGNADGAIDLSVTGGVTPYTYDWSNDGAEGPDNDTEDIAGLLAGVYTITVTDANGCTKTANATLTQPPAIVLTAVVADIPCGGAGNEGAIDLTASGGSPGYVYLWSNSETTEDLNGLSAGNYTVTVTDVTGCTETYTTNVNFGNPIPLPNFTITNVTCGTATADGAIAINTLPPTAQAPLTFSWTGPNGFTSVQQDISGLMAGNYSLSIQDALGCSYLATVVVGENPTTIQLAFSLTNVSCFGGNNGSINLTVSGGTSPYTYDWSGDGPEDPDNDNEDIPNSTAGTFTVTVTDALGCTKTGVATLVQPPNLVLSTSATSINCGGANSGAINLTVSGGTPGYTYLWNNSQTTEDISGLTAGTYTVTVTDANGCTKTVARVVTQPPAITLSTVVTNTSCSGANDGAINLTATGGAGGYTYAWSNTPATTQDLNNLTEGTYCVTVTDAVGCTQTRCATVVNTALPVFSIVSLSNDCNSEILSGPFMAGATYQWTGPSGTVGTSQSINATVSGLYTLTLSNSYGCTATANYAVSLAGGSACGRIHGKVLNDTQPNCQFDPGEPGLAGWLVRAEGADTLYGVTNASGEYFVGVPVGDYTMKALAPNGLWLVCPNPLMASLLMPDDTVSGGDLPVQSLYNCPLLSVSIGTNQLRRCFSNNYYTVKYCNEGTVPASDVYVVVDLDPLLSYVAASIPVINLGNNQYSFSIGDLDAGQCGQFNIQVAVSCNAVLGQTHCTSAHIYPDSTCLPSNPNWSGASLALRSVCSSDSLRFIVKNIGIAAMASSADYIVIEDAVMRMRATLPPLDAKDSITLAFPANGSTWRFEVDQEDFHPLATPPSVTLEGCTTNPSFSTGYVNQFALYDTQNYLDIDCTVNIGSFDPNDKHGYPVGYGADHYIRPGTDIEYLIRFQNTGTDTAFTVRVIDTLSSWLDPATIRFGAASHPYRYDLNGEGIVQITFEDILLPDSNTNEVASHGFVKFTLKPRADAPLQSRIENTAAIYFDFNDPVFTNTTYHRLGENFISVGIWDPFVAGAEVAIVPNPFQAQTMLEVRGLARTNGLSLQVFDLTGRVVREISSETGQFSLVQGDWPSGIYLFRITQQGRLVGSGKLMAE